MQINGTEIILRNLDGATYPEIRHYYSIVRDKEKDEVVSLTISGTCDGRVELDYVTRPPKFERIRRITGYLVGTLDRFNDGKRAEEHDRVKHGLGCGCNA